MKIRLGTLFSGIGAPEYAAKRVFDEVEGVFAVEIDKYARESFLANHKVKYMYNDVTEVDFTKHKGEIDILVGGSPCQSFSLAGKRGGFEDTRGTLFFHFARAIKECEPEFFIYENVKGMVSHDNGKTLDTVLRTFGELNYKIHANILNTKDYGVPQNRERFFVVGVKSDSKIEYPLVQSKEKNLKSKIYNNIAKIHHEGSLNYWAEYKWPDPIKLEKRLKDILETNVPEKYYLSTKMLKYLNGKNRSIKPFDGTQDYSGTLLACYYKTPTDGFYIRDIEEPQVDIIGMLDNKAHDICRRVYNIESISPTITAVQGGGQEPKIGAIRGRNPDNPASRVSGLPTEQMLELNKSGTSNCLTTVQKDNVVVENKIKYLGSIYDSEGIGVCLTAQGGGKGGTSNLYDIDSRVRKLTPRECLRLQDFPEDFKIVVSNTQIYKQAGNSMSVNVMAEIMKGIKRYKEGFVSEEYNKLMDKKSLELDEW